MLFNSNTYFPNKEYDEREKEEDQDQSVPSGILEALSEGLSFPGGGLFGGMLPAGLKFLSKRVK